MVIKVQPVLDEIQVAEESDQKKRTTTLSLYALKKFANETTLHGIRNIADVDSFIIRRVLWILVVLSCTGFCTNQFYERISRYISNPKSVNIEIVFVDEMPFPTVTICNYNAFKSTSSPPSILRATAKVAAVTGKTANTTFGNPVFLEDAINVEKEAKINLTELFLIGSHNMKSMLRECTFAGMPCTYRNFTPVFSDLSLCFQFNSDGLNLTVANTGSSTGLLMTLNAEQYAYVDFSKYAAGMVMAIHSPKEPALISQDSILVPVGGESQIALDMTELNLLPPPDGDCSSKTLDYYSSYSFAACRIECMTKHIVRHCGCRDNFMPGDAPVCDLVQHYMCDYPLQLNFSHSPESRSCACPPTCRERAYNPLLAFAPFSNLREKRLLQTMKSDMNVLLDYIAANDITDYQININQTKQDVAALLSFAPYLIAFAAECESMYSVLAQAVNLTVDLEQVARSTSALAAELNSSLLASEAAIRQVETLLQSINATLQIPPGLGPNVSQFLLMALNNRLEGSGRTLTFDLFRLDSEASNFTRILLALNSTLTLWEDALNDMLMRVTTSTGISSSIVAKTSSTIASLRNSAQKMQIVLQQLVQQGLSSIELYTKQADVKAISAVPISDSLARDNLMIVNIYMKKMHYQSIDKQLSDNVVGLICDLGGIFGLFLGASLMSLYEFIDIAVYFLGRLYLSSSN